MGTADLKAGVLEAALSAMRRNRALLFTINLLAAMVLMVVYLEEASFDDSQRNKYMFAIDDIRRHLVTDAHVPGDIACQCPDQVEAWALAHWSTLHEDEQSAASYQVTRLRRVVNDVGHLTLPGPVSIPLPLGISVPRNDVMPLVGLVMIVLYSWLYFSFRQLARVSTVLRALFLLPAASDATPPGEADNVTMLTTLLEVNLLFRASGGPTAWFVRLLFLAAPISMSMALGNDIITLMATSWKSALLLFTIPRYLLLSSVTVALWFIGYWINQADKECDEALAISKTPATSHGPL